MRRSCTHEEIRPVSDTVESSRHDTDDGEGAEPLPHEAEGHRDFSESHGKDLRDEGLSRVRQDGKRSVSCRSRGQHPSGMAEVTHERDRVPSEAVPSGIEEDGSDSSVISWSDSNTSGLDTSSSLSSRKEQRIISMVGHHLEEREEQRGETYKVAPDKEHAEGQNETSNHQGASSTDAINDEEPEDQSTDALAVNGDR